MKTRLLFLFPLALAIVAGVAVAFGADLSGLLHVAGGAGRPSGDPLALAGLALAGVTVDLTEAIGRELQRIGNETRDFSASYGQRLQAVEQIVAGADALGFSGRRAARGEPVSAAVLRELEGSLEDLRSGKVKSLRASIPTVHAATLTSPDVPLIPERDTEVYGPLPAPTSVRDLLVTRRTGASAIEYIQATRTGSAGIQALEGDEKPQIDLGFALKSAPVRTIAAWVPASRQVLDDASMLGDVIDTQLRDAVRAKEDQQLLNGDGIGSNIGGLIPAATAYSRAQAGDTPVDAVRRAVTQLQLARGQATGLVVNPEGLELLELQKDANGRYILALEVTDSNGRTTVWRTPTVVSDAIGATQFLLSDFRRSARLYDRMQALVEVATQHADFFTKNLVAVLCEERVALTIPRPDLLIIGNLVPAP